MASSAYDTFKVTHGRGKEMVERSVKLAKALLKTTSKLSVADYNSPEYVADLGRSGMVTTVAALDRYFTTKFAECVIPVLKHEGPSEGLLKILSNAGLDLKGALGLLHMERPHRRIGSLIRQHLSEFTTQRFATIDELFKAIGVPDLSHHAQNKAERTKLKVSIDGLIRRRHVIVHEGDVDKFGNLKPLDPYDAIRRIDNVLLLVSCAEEIVNNRMKKCKASRAKKKPTKKVGRRPSAKSAAGSQKNVLAAVSAALQKAASSSEAV